MKTALVVATKHDHPTTVVSNALQLLPSILENKGLSVTALIPAKARSLSSRLSELSRKPPFDLVVAGGHGIFFRSNDSSESRRFAGMGLHDGNEGLLLTKGHCRDMGSSTIVLNACLRWDGELPWRIVEQLQSNVTILGYHNALMIGSAKAWSALKSRLAGKYADFERQFSSTINCPVLQIVDGRSPAEAVDACRASWYQLRKDFDLGREMLLVCAQNERQFMNMDRNSLAALRHAPVTPH